MILQIFIYYLTFLTCKMKLLEIKTATITEKGQIALPKDIRSGKFKEGSKIAILAFKDHIELRPIKDIEDKMKTAIASEKVLAKDWNSKEEDITWKNL